MADQPVPEPVRNPRKLSDKVEPNPLWGTHSDPTKPDRQSTDDEE